MKNKLIRLIGVLAVIFFALGFAGCSIGMDSLEEILNKNNLTAQITYYSNGGWFNEDTDSKSRDVYYKENSKALEINDQTQTKINHSEDIYSGWYTIKTVQIDGEDYFVCNETAETKDNFIIDGSVLVIENNGEYVVKISDYQKLVTTKNVPLLELDEAFDFANTRLKKGDKLYLAALWLPNQKIEYVLFTEDCESVTVRNKDGSTTVVNNGETIATKMFNKDGTFLVPTEYDLLPATTTDATFVDYYAYEEGALNEDLVRLIDVTQQIQRPQDGENYKVFVKYVFGEWNVVREASDVKSLFNKPSAKKFYLSQDIDCSQQSAITLSNATFSGTIRGNGYEIKGLNLKTNDLSNGATISLFGTITSDTVIKDVTFSDVTLSVNTRKFANSFIKVNLFATAFSTDDGNATIENVTIDGVNVLVNLKEGVNIEYIYQSGATYDASEWLKRSLCNAITNEELKESYPTLQVKNYQVSINNEVVVSDTSEE